MKLSLQPKCTQHCPYPPGAGRQDWIMVHPTSMLTRKGVHVMGERKRSAEGSSATELQNFSKQHVRASQHTLTLQGETEDTDSSEVWEILAVITKMKFDYVANTTAVQLHLK